MKQPAIDLQVIKVQSRFVPMGWLSNRAPMALFKRRGGSHICEQVALKKRVSQYPTYGFESLEGAREWTYGFVHWYNEIHRHSALKYVTPGQRHRGESGTILAARKQVFEEAKRKYPERWNTRPVRNLEEEKVVWLNPEKDERALETLTPEKRQVG